MIKYSFVVSYFNLSAKF